MVFFWKRKKIDAAPPPAEAEPSSPASAAKRGEVRVRLLPLHGIRFEMTVPEKARVEVVNLGPDGVGLYRNSRDAWPQIGATVEGELVVEGKRAGLEMEIVHISGLVVGCRALRPSPELRNLINHFFDVEVAASGLREANPAVLRKDPEGEPRWFMGSNNCELFLIHQGDRLVRFELSLYGANITGAPGMPPHYGFIVDDESKGGLHYKGSAIVRGISHMPEDMAHKAIRFVENVQALSPALRSAISEIIQRS